MIIEIPDELYEKYQMHLGEGYSHESVTQHIEFLIHMELVRNAVPGFDEDLLTHLKTRHKLEQDIGLQIRGFNSRDTGQWENAFLCIDIDGFKHFNDYQGLAAGDEALKKLADALRAAYPHNTIYRVGGDEFVVDLKTQEPSAINQPQGPELKQCVVIIRCRKNPQQICFIEQAIQFHLQEGMVKATREGARLEFDYTDFGTTSTS
jgi:diguanylate cyclase (GGDEF)-like protein